MLAIAGRDEGRQPDIETEFTACGWQPFPANVAGPNPRTTFRLCGLGSRALVVCRPRSVPTSRLGRGELPRHIFVHDTADQGLVGDALALSQVLDLC